ncbi:hypothetical protein [Tepidibacillus sp. HK-1]|uniref:hypothetical protein n=1 Tax=Tepidibacillus sp. HK-1 TaxID=1883407 RepID=UPI0008538BBF|nr:hypothetical protein [Tepidibacillus sp. HK-1]GBF12284.1 hypothetical protein HK1_02345 [Tepidibacillus sp. HK-1]
MSSSQRKICKYTDFTPGDIKMYLEKFRKAILDGKYIISKNQNRHENINFIEDYRIDTKKEKEILLGIQYDDFCYAVDNEKEEFAHEKLYIFSKYHELDYWGTLESVDIYIKINMTQTRKGDDFTIVVSFHKRNKPIKYLFK